MSLIVIIYFICNEIYISINPKVLQILNRELLKIKHTEPKNKNNRMKCDKLKDECIINRYTKNTFAIIK